MIGLPRGWSRSTIGDICRVVSGATPSTAVETNWGGDILWLTPQDLAISSARVTYSGRRNLTQQGYDSCSTRLLPVGSVLFSSRAPIGYVTIAGAPICTNQGFKNLIVPDVLESSYLYWYLQYATDEIRSRASGTTFKEISARGFAETPLIFPPLPGQRRIVAALDEATSRMELSLRDIKNARRSADAYEAGVIRREVCGQWPLKSLNELASSSSYGTSAKCEGSGTGPAVVRIPNIKDGRVDLAYLKRAVDPHLDLERKLLKRGDVLFVRTNGSKELIGRAGLVTNDPGASYASYLIRFQFFRSIVEPAWVVTVINSPAFRRGIEELAASSAGQYNLNITKLGSIKIPVPPLEKQREVLNGLSDVADTRDRLVSVLDGMLTKSAKFKKALLTAAFSGHLGE